MLIFASFIKQLNSERLIMAKTNKSKKLAIPLRSTVGIVKHNPLVSYLLQSKDEFKKIIWPTRKETIRLTIVVIIASALIGTLLTIIDLGLAKVVDSLLKL